MTDRPHGLDDPDHLAALRRSGLVGGGPDEGFDRLTRLASLLLGVPTALVTLLDDDRQILCSAVGLPGPSPADEAPAPGHSFTSRVAETGEPLLVEDVRAHPDLRRGPVVPGVGFVVSYAGFPVRTPDGRVVAVLCAIRTEPGPWSEDDATLLEGLAGAAATEIELRFVVEAMDRMSKKVARTRAEAEAARRRVRDLVEGLDAVVWEMDAGTRRFTFVSRQAEELLGYPTEEWIRDPDFWPDRVVHPDDREWASHYVDEAMREGRDHTFDYRAVAADGRVLWLRDVVRVVEDEDGAATLRGVMLDVTERKRAIEELRRSERRFRSLIEGSTEIITLLDADGTILYESPALESILGYRPENLEGRDPFEMVHPDDRESARVAFRRAKEVGEPRTTELRFPHRDGGWRTLSLTFRSCLDDPAVEAVVVNTRDVTEERVLEERFRQVQKMEAVGRLAGGVAHDFNNLLTSIVGFTEMARDEIEDDSPAAEDLDEVLHAADLARRLTRQLLAFSRQQVLRPRVLDLGRVVESMETMLGRMVGDDVEMAVEVADEPCRVKADPGQVEQVVLNLAVNARDAMPDGGRLVLRVDRDELTAADAEAREHTVIPGSYVRLTVEDTGHGMDEETREKIFEPFYTTRSAEEGTGLGLATVYGIVKQSGGYIWAESEPGEGAVFQVYLPRVEAELDEARGLPDERGRAVGGSGETVLVVEDEEPVRRLARRALEGRGYRVRTASSAEKALEEILADDGGSLDLLLTDVVLPGMGGRELAREVERRLGPVPTVYMSGYTQDEVIRRGGMAEGDRFVEKPFRPAGLVRVVRDVLDGTGDGGPG